MSPCRTKKRKVSPNRWFHSGKRLNWSKDDTQAVRRRNALSARRGNFLKAGRALQALANITQDEETARKARADALYFFAQLKKRKE